MSKHLYVMVGVPSTEVWTARFGMSLCSMVADFTSAPIEGYAEQRIQVRNKKGSILPQLRYQLAKEALAAGASHLLFVDSDQSFPADTLRRLLEAKKPVVACNVVTKQYPFTPTARRKSEKNPTGEVVYTVPGGERYERVWRVGTGVMLIETYVFEVLPKPWFLDTYKPDVDDLGGEDWYFCSLLEQAGIWVYVDHELSWEVGHCGMQEYDHRMAINARFVQEQTGRRENENREQETEDVRRLRSDLQVGGGA